MLATVPLLLPTVTYCDLLGRQHERLLAFLAGARGLLLFLACHDRVTSFPWIG